MTDQISVQTGLSVELEENQKEVSYKKLFGNYIKNVRSILLKDPYIRTDLQIRNLKEFAELIADNKDPNVHVDFHLITSLNEDRSEEVHESLQLLSDSLKTQGIVFTYEFESNFHDRIILVDDRWKIVLSRGLEIWKNTVEQKSINQKERLCNKCSISFIKVQVGS